MNPIICFIDDSPFEHALVKDEIAPAAPDILFLQAYTFDEARGLLKRDVPVLFLLDLWGQDPDVKEPSITPLKELERRTAEFNTLQSVYAGLDRFPGDKTNEYLKRLFVIVESWRRLFEDTCDRIGQNRKYGLANIKRAHEHYPGIPAVFYTRKSLINDAVSMFQAGAEALFIKPTGKNDDETRARTRRYAPRLVQDLVRLLDQRFHPFSDSRKAHSVEIKKESDVFYRASETWKTFRSK
jgi:hypothetical protein